MRWMTFNNPPITLSKSFMHSFQLSWVFMLYIFLVGERVLACGCVCVGGMMVAFGQNQWMLMLMSVNTCYFRRRYSQKKVFKFSYSCLITVSICCRGGEASPPIFVAERHSPPSPSRTHTLTFCRLEPLMEDHITNEYFTSLLVA